MAGDRIGLVVAGVGLVAVLIALLSSPLGVSHGFGAKHIVLLLAGIGLIVGGLVAQRRTAR